MIWQDVLRRSIVLLISILLIQFGHAQRGYSHADYYEMDQGARATALGGAFTAAANDLSGLHYNPASLAYLERGEFDLNLRLKADVINMEQTIPNIESLNISSYGIIHIPNLAIGVPFEVGNTILTGAVGYKPLYDWTVQEKWSSVYNDGTVQDRIDEYIFDRGGIQVLTAGFAMKSIDQFSIGVSFNQILGRSTSSYSWYVDDVQQDTSSWRTTNIRGRYAEIGIMYRPWDALSIGGKFNLPYSRTSDYVDIDSIITGVSLRVPVLYNIGISVAPSDRVKFNAEIRRHDWRKATVKISEFESDFAQNQLQTFHLGCEYMANYYGANEVPLRFGYQTRQYLSIDANGNRLTSNIVSLGLGINGEEVILDGACQFEFFDSWQYSRGGGGDIYESGVRVMITGGLKFFFGMEVN